MKHKLLPWGSVSLFVLFQFTLQLSSGTLMPSLMHDFHINATLASILVSCYYWVYALMQVPGGFLFDKWNAKTILSLGAACAGIGCILFSLGHSFAIALLGRMAFGAGASVAFIGLIYITRTHFPFRYFAFLIGLSETIALICSLAATVGFAYIFKIYGWRQAFFIAGLLAFVLAILSFLYIPNSPKSDQNLKFNTVFKQLKLVFKNHEIWLNGLYIAISFSLITVFAALWSTPFLMAKLHINLAQASKLSGYTFLGAALSCPIFGYLGNVSSNRQLVLFCSSFISTLLLLTIIYSPSHNYLFYAGLMFSLGLICASYMIAFAISDELATAEIKNTVAGFTNLLAVASAPLIQPLIGFIIDSQQLNAANSNQAYQHALLVMPVLTAINCIIIFFLPQRSASEEVATA